MNMLHLVQAKRDGREHSVDELNWLMGEVVKGTIPDYQLSAWLMAVYFRGMTPTETAGLTRAMVNTGRRLDLSSLGPHVADKHSTGGVGDKTSLLVAPMVAACGVPVAKMSGRGLGFSGGTLDKLESIPGFRVELSAHEFVAAVRTVGLVIASQSPDLAPADGKLYALRDVTATVESLPLIASSIMSKKIAAGANAVVLDVKVGRGAFMKSLDEARALAAAMRDIGREVGRNVRAVISDMEQPLGNAVGNALEVREAIESLRGSGPPDLMEVALELGTNLLEMTGRAGSTDEGRALLVQAINSGQALERFRAFVANQGGDPVIVDHLERLPKAPVQYEVTAPSAGYVRVIDAEAIGRASVEIGAGRKVKGEKIDPSVGFVLHSKVGDAVREGDSLATIHAAGKEDAERIAPALLGAFDLTRDPVAAPRVIIETVK
ncbi:MAG TPA: thymidine phosphorylase [Chloroflexia bacterium]|nr:thymidine phosphorylase [Chloroflexia bacterium]